MCTSFNLTRAFYVPFLNFYFILFYFLVQKEKAWVEYSGWFTAQADRDSRLDPKIWTMFKGRDI